MRKSVVLAIAIFLWFGFLCPLQANQTPENGIVKELDVQGRVRAILKYKEGELIRKKIYHENGKLILDVVYKKNKPIFQRSYYITGVLKSEWTLKSGETRYYTPTGKHQITVKDRK